MSAAGPSGGDGDGGWCCTATAAVAGGAVQGRWFQRHPFPHAVGVVSGVAAELRQQHGAKKVGLQG